MAIVGDRITFVGDATSEDIEAIETIDVSGLDASLIREVGVTPGVDHVWVLDSGPIELTVAVEAIPNDEPEPDPS